jgi:hypothetical protein
MIITILICYVHTEFSWGNIIKNNHFEDQEEDERIILTLNLDK